MFFNLLSISAFCIVWEKIIFPILRILISALRKPLKPFDCAPCLSFWIGWGYIYFYGGFVLLPFLIYICTIILYRLYDRSTI